jgi:uncharacterized protein (DUF58 family)
MKSLLDLKTLARIKDLPLVAKTIAHGFLHGVHHSIQRGVGIEFSQYRVYEPGDQLSSVDWKLFARSDRYFVREAERESDINVWFVMDSSESMKQRSSFDSKGKSQRDKNSEDSLSKFDYGKILLSTLAYMVQKQGDSIGFIGLSHSGTNKKSSENKHYLPALSGERHWQKILISLTNMVAGGYFPKASDVEAQCHAMRKNGLIFVISDFYQQDEEINNLLSQLSNSRTEVIAIQLSSNDEINFPYQGMVRFEDLETKQQRLVSAKQIKIQYLAAQAKFNEELEQSLKEKQVTHWQVNIDEPMDETLARFLQLRQRRFN